MFGWKGIVPDVVHIETLSWWRIHEIAEIAQLVRLGRHGDCSPVVHTCAQPPSPVSLAARVPTHNCRRTVRAVTQRCIL